MGDSLKMFLIALVTAVAVQALLGPSILELRGFRRPAAREDVAAPIDTAPPSDAPAREGSAWHCGSSPRT